LMARHGDLFRPEYWRGVQQELRGGHLPEILPYAEERRLGARKKESGVAQICSAKSRTNG
jgi:isocitrate dehydrogenase kinase/phosphatase